MKITTMALFITLLVLPYSTASADSSANGFKAEYHKNCVLGCTGEIPASYPDKQQFRTYCNYFCDCAVEKLTGKYTDRELTELEKLLNDPAQQNSERIKPVMDIIYSCANSSMKKAGMNP
jgi:hypothetical protein